MKEPKKEPKTVILTFRVEESLRDVLREKYGYDGELSKKFQKYALELAEK